jgi:hypothetical protein
MKDPEPESFLSLVLDIVSIKTPQTWVSRIQTEDDDEYEYEDDLNPLLGTRTPHPA